MLHGLQRAVDVPAELIGLAQAAQRAFAVRRGGVEQDARHRAVFAGGRLADAGRRIATFQRQLAHERVREGARRDSLAMAWGCGAPCANAHGLRRGRCAACRPLDARASVQKPLRGNCRKIPSPRTSAGSSAKRKNNEERDTGDSYCRGVPLLASDRTDGRPIICKKASVTGRQDQPNLLS